MKRYEGPGLADMEEAGRRLGRLLGDALPEGVGFALHLWSYGEGGWATFISNVEREDHIEALREFVRASEEEKRG